MTSSPRSGVHASNAGIWFGVLLAVVASALFIGGARSASQAQRLIAFTRWDGVYVMRSDGADVQHIRRVGAYGLAWSPDGRTLAFTDGVHVWVMNADGTHLTRLARAPDLVHGSLMSPAWSPDGRRIAFTASGGEDRDIWVVNSDGSRLRRLVRTPGIWEYELDWSPNGRRVAFTDLTNRVSRLYVMNADGSHPRSLAPPGREGWFEAVSPKWSPDGRRIAVSRRVGSTPVVHGIWVLDPRTRVGRSLSPEASSDTHPTWSPDGTKIAFVRGGGKWTDCLGCSVPRRDSSEIYVMNADGTGVTRLTHNGVGEADPAWQPVALP